MMSHKGLRVGSDLLDVELSSRAPTRMKIFMCGTFSAAVGASFSNEVDRYGEDFQYDAYKIFSLGGNDLWRTMVAERAVHVPSGERFIACLVRALEPRHYSLHKDASYDLYREARAGVIVINPAYSDAFEFLEARIADIKRYDLENCPIFVMFVTRGVEGEDYSVEMRWMLEHCAEQGISVFIRHAGRCSLLPSSAILSSINTLLAKQGLLFSLTEVEALQTLVPKIVEHVVSPGLGVEVDDSVLDRPAPAVSNFSRLLCLSSPAPVSVAAVIPIVPVTRYTDFLGVDSVYYSRGGRVPFDTLSRFNPYFVGRTSVLPGGSLDVFFRDAHSRAISFRFDDGGLVSEERKGVLVVELYAQYLRATSMPDFLHDREAQARFCDEFLRVRFPGQYELLSRALSRYVQDFQHTSAQPLRTVLDGLGPAFELLYSKRGVQFFLTDAGHLRAKTSIELYGVHNKESGQTHALNGQLSFVLAFIAGVAVRDDQWRIFGGASFQVRTNVDACKIKMLLRNYTSFLLTEPVFHPEFACWGIIRFMFEFIQDQVAHGLIPTAEFKAAHCLEDLGNLELLLAGRGHSAIAIDRTLYCCMDSIGNLLESYRKICGMRKPDPGLGEDIVGYNRVMALCKLYVYRLLIAVCGSTSVVEAQSMLGVKIDALFFDVRSRLRTLEEMKVFVEGCLNDLDRSLFGPDFFKQAFNELVVSQAALRSSSGAHGGAGAGASVASSSALVVMPLVVQAANRVATHSMPPAAAGAGAT